MILKLDLERLQTPEEVNSWLATRWSTSNSPAAVMMASGGSWSGCTISTCLGLTRVWCAKNHRYRGRRSRDIRQYRQPGRSRTVNSCDGGVTRCPVAELDDSARARFMQRHTRSLRTAVSSDWPACRMVKRRCNPIWQPSKILRVDSVQGDA